MPICPKCRATSLTLGERCPRDGYYFVDDDAIEGAYVDPWLGRIIDERYVILALISEGGMGAVYRAMQLPMRREVAVKVLRAGIQDSIKGQERFAREALAISRLQHPNIITLHDFGFERQLYPYMVMEYAPGQELSRWLCQTDLCEERLFHVARQILSALAEAHRQGIVHRDLKPSNVIITRAGDDVDFPKLLDFGIARLLNEEFTHHLTGDGEVFGTPHYMSPEQAQGRRDIGPATDIYAMGVMLYEFFSGHQPFVGDTPLAILFKHLHEPFPPFTARQGLILPSGMAGFIEQAAHKEAKERFQDAAAMLIAFDELFGRTPRVVTPFVEETAPEDPVEPSPQNIGSVPKTKELFPSPTPVPETPPIATPLQTDAGPTAELDRQDRTSSGTTKIVIALSLIAIPIILLGGGVVLGLVFLAGGGEEAAAQKPSDIQSINEQVLPLAPAVQAAPTKLQVELREETADAKADAERDVVHVPRREPPQESAAEESIPSQEKTRPSSKPQRRASLRRVTPLSEPEIGPKEKQESVKKLPPPSPPKPTTAEPDRGPLPPTPVPEAEEKHAPAGPARFERPAAAPTRFDRPAH